MSARPWFVLTAICTIVCTSGCGSARWGSRHSRLRMPSACVESSCDDPTCEICSPLPPLYDGMARNHRLQRRAMRGHGHGHARGRQSFGGGCSCGQCGGEWFEGEIIDGEIIGGDCFGGCSSCSSCGDGGMMMDGMVMDGMPMEMSGGCSTCQQSAMFEGSMPHQSMMQGQPYGMGNEQQPTLANPHSSSVPSGGMATPPPSVPPHTEQAPAPMAEPMGNPMGSPMGSPMNGGPMNGSTTSMRTTNYGAALFGTNPAEPKQYTPAPMSQPIMHEESVPLQEAVESPAIPPAPPLASPAAHAIPMMMSPPAMPTFPGEMPGAPQPSDYYSPKDNPTSATQPTLTPPNPIQLQNSTFPVATPGKKAMRPFSEAAKPRKPSTQPEPQLQPLAKTQPQPRPAAAPQSQAQPQPLAKLPAPPAAPKQPRGQPQLEGSLRMQTVQQASAELPALPKSMF